MAFRLGYSEARFLARHVQWMTGLTPSAVRTTLCGQELLDLLTQRVLRPVPATTQPDEMYRTIQ